MDTFEFPAWIREQSINRFIKLIQNHHTYLPDYTHFNGKNHFQRLRAMRNYHTNELGWRDIAQNITTFPDGKIAICRNIDDPPAGIAGFNSHAICIEHLGNFDLERDKMTEAHKESIIMVNAGLCLKFNCKPDIQHIVYHHWFDLITRKRMDGEGTTKSCPGTDFFNGNSVEAAKQFFIPLVTARMHQLGSFSSGCAEIEDDDILGFGLVTALCLNVRSGPGADYEIRGKLVNGSTIPICQKMNGWYRIANEDKWVYSKFIHRFFFGQVDASRLNVRNGPGTRYRVIDVLEKNDKVRIFKRSGKWCQIELRDKWVHKDYLTIEK